MTNTKTSMRQKIRQDLLDKRITSLLPKGEAEQEQIHYIHAINPMDTYIEYLFYKSTKTDYSGNKAHSKVHYIQVDIFSKGDFTKLQEALEEVLEEKGYVHEDEFDGYEEDTKLYTHKIRVSYKEML